jgi:hypothetical protein
MMDGVDESFETIDESFETILFELTPLAEGPATYADPSPPQMSAVTLEQLAIKRVCAERLKNTTNKLKAKFDAQTKELTDAQAEAASWRKQYESQAAVKELNELKKAMERAASSTNEAIHRLKELNRKQLVELNWYRFNDPASSYGKV